MNVVLDRKVIGSFVKVINRNTPGGIDFGQFIVTDKNIFYEKRRKLHKPLARPHS
jgi:hypothetical protein